jgi:hypothetical protein
LAKAGGFNKLRASVGKPRSFVLKNFPPLPIPFPEYLQIFRRFRHRQGARRAAESRSPSRRDCGACSAVSAWTAFFTFKKLQTAAVAAVGNGVPANRALLANLHTTSEGDKVGEGTVVELIGILINGGSRTKDEHAACRSPSFPRVVRIKIAFPRRRIEQDKGGTGFGRYRFRTCGSRRVTPVYR